MTIHHKFKKLGRPNLLVIFQSANSHLYKAENSNKFEYEGTFLKQEYDVPSCDYLFVKDGCVLDKSKGWYISPNEGVDYMRNFLLEQKSKYNKIIATGFSSGGFASILFGSLCEFDLVLALSPQTILYELDPNKPHIPKSTRLNNFVNPGLSDTYLDCEPYINNFTKYYLHSCCKKKYDECSYTDRLHHFVHIERLNHFDNVDIVYIERLIHVNNADSTRVGHLSPDLFRVIIMSL